VKANVTVSTNVTPLVQPTPGPAVDLPKVFGDTVLPCLAILLLLLILFLIWRRRKRKKEEAKPAGKTQRKAHAIHRGHPDAPAE
jgi:uncharacterized membrane protein YccC